MAAQHPQVVTVKAGEVPEFGWTRCKEYQQTNIQSKFQGKFTQVILTQRRHFKTSFSLHQRKSWYFSSENYNKLS